MVGCETAEFLAERGNNPIVGGTHVTIVVRSADARLSNLPAQQKQLLLERMQHLGITFITSAPVEEILEDGVRITRSGVSEELRGFDWIVLALGIRSVDELTEKIRGTVKEVYVIGDAREPRLALEAIADGAETGRKI